MVYLRFSPKQGAECGKSVVEHLNKNDIKCDVVISPVFSPNFFIANQIKKYFNVPIIYGLHQTDIDRKKKKYYFNIIEQNYPYIDGFVYRLTSLKRMFERYFNKSVKSIIIPFGISLNIINTSIQLKNKKKLYL